MLVNLNEEEVWDINNNVARYQEFRKKDPELQEILIRNGVSIEGQEAILQQLFSDLAVPTKRDLIVWSQIDSSLYGRLQYLFDLCWENLSTKEERKSFGPKGWVVNKIASSCYRKTATQIIDQDIEYKAKKLAEGKNINCKSTEDMFRLFPDEMQRITDDVIERVFALQKNWLQYRAPKWINVVDSLQKYATAKLGIASGDYAYVAEMIENEFVQSSLRIFLEYGIPLSAVQKIQDILQRHKVNVSKITEDQAVTIISKHRKEIYPYLTAYEAEILERAI